MTQTGLLEKVNAMAQQHRRHKSQSFVYEPGKTHRQYATEILALPEEQRAAAIEQLPDTKPVAWAHIQGILSAREYVRLMAIDGPQRFRARVATASRRIAGLDSRMERNRALSKVSKSIRMMVEQSVIDIFKARKQRGAGA